MRPNPSASLDHEYQKLIDMFATRIAASVAAKLSEPTNSQPMLYSRDEAADRMSVSLSTLKAIISRREIAVVRQGSKVLISHQAIQDWIKRKEE